MKSCTRCGAQNEDAVLMCTCGCRFPTFTAPPESALEDATPNIRGPSVLAKIGVGILGYVLGCVPLAVVETILEQSGRPVGPSYRGAYFPMGIFGAWLALRLLKRRR